MFMISVFLRPVGTLVHELEHTKLLWEIQEIQESCLIDYVSKKCVCGEFEMFGLWHLWILVILNLTF